MIAGMLLAGSILPPKSCFAQDLNPVTVQRSIDHAIKYLKDQQGDRGGWKEAASRDCGMSALCTLAMLNAGVPKDDPAVLNAMRYLRSQRASCTYAVALLTLVYCDYGAAGDLPRIRSNVQWLVNAQLIDGSWTYRKIGQRSGDPSNSQFALLALGAAEDHGIEVPQEAFEKALQYWKKSQLRSGGWRYNSINGQASGSMTCAGVASITIARSQLKSSSASIEGDKIVCCGGEDDEDPVEKGLAWLGENFTTETNPGGMPARFYYLYAVERTGRLTGRRFIGPHDWYRAGAKRLLETQDDFLGFWNGSGGLIEPQLAATSFGLLFLAKGKRRVVVGHLEHDSDAKRWQRHPDALGPLVRQVEQSWNQKLTWQTIRVESAKVRDLLQAPVIVITGNQTLRLSDASIKTLGEYINQGGTILFDADGGAGCPDASDFEASVKDLCGKWFDGAVPQRLAVGHPVWSASTPVDPSGLPADAWMYGVEACCRTSVFYFPKSLSCRWSLAGALNRRSEALSDQARTSIETSVRLGENVLAYATGRQLKDKLANKTILPKGVKPDVKRGAVQIATLGIDTGGKTAKRAVPNITAVLSRTLPIQIFSPEKPVGFDDDSLAEVSYLWVHGQGEWSLNAEQKNALRKFLDRGGILIGSAICADEPFAKSFRSEIETICGRSLEVIQPDDPILRVPTGYDLSNLTMRKPIRNRTAGDQLAQQKGPPVLETVRDEDGLVTVVFSPLDISCALESPNSVQCPGYNTSDAAKIVANIILLGMSQ